MSARLWKGWRAAIVDMRKNQLGGVCFNDGYNMQTFGITRTEFIEMQKRAEDAYGMDWREAPRKVVLP